MREGEKVKVDGAVGVVVVEVLVVDMTATGCFETVIKSRNQEVMPQRGCGIGVM